MKNKKLIEVFEDTKKIVNSRTEDPVSITYKSGFREDPADVIVENLDTVSAIVKYGKTSLKVCALNMASPKWAGGGVATGARAQEECLFRCSDLFDTVTQDLYPLRDNHFLYTQDAAFIKDKDYNVMDDVVCDVITIAAVNLNKDSYYDKVKEEYVNVITDKEDNYYDLTKQKIRSIFLECRENRVNNIVLGAWGCGVFKNDPKDIAKMFKDVLVGEGYDHYFRNVVFAVINDKNSVDNNYEIFKEILG